MTAAVAEMHASWCSGGCPRWLSSGAPTCLPIPCQCARTRADAPGWSDGKCWWIKKGGTQVRSRCPCWGGKRDDRPGDCCAHHSANPLYQTPNTGTADPEDDATLTALAVVEDDSAPFEVPTDPAGWHAPHEYRDWQGDEDDEQAWGPDPAKVRKPFERRWPAEDLTCPCVLTYANDKRTANVHCVQCCQDFANPKTFSVHRRDWTRPCRPPQSIVDCDTGRPLLYQDGGRIWRDSYPSAA